MRSLHRSTLILGAALVLPAAGLVLGVPNQARAQTMQVTIKNFAFSPNPVTVPAGTTVTWTNQDTAPHTATADDNSWTTKQLSQGQSDSVTFNTPGTFTYHCSVHPNMKATLVVTAAASTPGGATATPAPTQTSGPPLAAHPVMPSARTIVVKKAHSGLRVVPGFTLINPGTKVTWRNATGSSLSILGKGAWTFTSRSLGRHQRTSHVFSSVGVYHYTLSGHPNAVGEIKVSHS